MLNTLGGLGNALNGRAGLECVYGRPRFEAIQAEFRQALADCQQLYQTAAQQCVEHHPALVGDSPEQFLRLMEDLGKGLVMKIYPPLPRPIAAGAGRKQLAEILFEALWGQPWRGMRCAKRRFAFLNGRSPAVVQPGSTIRANRRIARADR